MIFKIAIFAIVCYVLYRLFMNDKKKKQESEEKQKKAKIKSEEMVQDPVCGTYVEKDSAITVRNGDTVHYFCSYECRQKYIESIGAQKKLN